MLSSTDAMGCERDAASGALAGRGQHVAIDRWNGRVPAGRGADLTNPMRGTASIFSSDRERRLWLWTLAAVAAIYATLGLASRLADLWYDQGVSAVVFLGAMLLIGVAILTQGLSVRPGGREVGVGLGIAVVYAFMLFRMTMPERSHLIEYSVVAVFVYEALLERASQGRRVPAPALLAVLLTSLVGVVDEGIQVVLPSRVFDPLDILFNAFAAGMAVIAMAVLRWARRRRRSGERQTGAR